MEYMSAGSEPGHGDEFVEKGALPYEMNPGVHIEDENTKHTYEGERAAHMSSPMVEERAEPVLDKKADGRVEMDDSQQLIQRSLERLKELGVTEADLGNYVMQAKITAILGDVMKAFVFGDGESPSAPSETIDVSAGGAEQQGIEYAQNA